MVLRRMALVGDALSHVALPGIALALLFHLNPFVGAFAFLFGAIGGIWLLEERTHASVESLVGIFFTLSLAFGILLTPEPELLEALFGEISEVSIPDAVFAILLSLGVLGAAYCIKKASLLGIVSRDLAVSAGANPRMTNLIFLLLVAAVVALGIKVTGTLLTGALVVIPAMAAKNIVSRFYAFAGLSIAFGALSTVGGILVAQMYELPPGPIIVLAGGILFITSLAFRLLRRT